MILRWPKYPVPKWVLKRMDERIVEGMFDAHMAGRLDEYTNRQVQRVLFTIRSRHALAPYIALLKSFFRIFKLIWEIIHGKYWRAAKKIHGGSNATSGAGPGAGGAPGAQWSSYAGGFTSGAGAGTATSNARTSASVAGVFSDAGIKAGEVTGFRCWQLHPDGFLHSVVYADFVWKPGRIAEGNPAYDHAGIYAYKSVLDLHNYGSPEPGTVSGTVDMWGEVYEHERGYRAQYAAIASIDDSPHYDAAALRELYGLNKKKRKKK